MKKITTKQPKKLTRTQKILLSEKKLDPANWMLQEELTEGIAIVNKKSGKVRVITW